MNALNNKRKITQNDLRLLMKKQKLVETEKKIDSPLAKYKDDGTLMCIICESAVKNSAIWHIHINSKQHRDNINKKKQLRKNIPVEPVPPIKLREKSPVKITNVPKPKGILKNKLNKEPIAISNSVKNLSFNNVPSTFDTINQEEEKEESKMDIVPNELPEGFFDDPIMDAKARNIEYKNPQDEEWERFQKEIQQEIISSEQMSDEELEATLHRNQVEQVDAKIQEWSQMMVLENKVEMLKKKSEFKKKFENESIQKADTDSSSESDDDLQEFINWRSKKSF